MTRYRYNEQFDPPAPFVYVRLYSLKTGADYGELPAQLDTGADRTVVPTPVVEALGPQPLGETTVAGLEGEQFQLPLFGLHIEPRHLPPTKATVAASPGERYV